MHWIICFILCLTYFTQHCFLKIIHVVVDINSSLISITESILHMNMPQIIYFNVDRHSYFSSFCLLDFAIVEAKLWGVSHWITTFQGNTNVHRDMEIISMDINVKMYVCSSIAPTSTHEFYPQTCTILLKLITKIIRKLWKTLVEFISSQTYWYLCFIRKFWGHFQTIKPFDCLISSDGERSGKISHVCLCWLTLFII